MTATADLRHVLAGLRTWLEWQGENRATGLPATRSHPRPHRVAAPRASPARSPTSPAARAEPTAVRETLADVRRDLGECTRCRLHQGRTQIVFGVGSPHARLMFVGEGPGAEEDRQGEPFVGPAGQLLTKMITAMGLARDDVYIANIVKCRPPQNRDPMPDEVGACSPFLQRQIGAIRPEVVVALGRPAAQMLLGTDQSISRLRGRWARLDFAPHTPVLPTYHPAYLLRAPEHKREAWSDLQDVMKVLGLVRPAH